MRKATNPVKACLNAAIKSQLMLTEVLASPEKVKGIAETIAEYPISPAHKAIVDEIVAAKESGTKGDVGPVEVLHKPQAPASQYSTKTNGNRQSITAKNETPWSYGGIDIV